MEGVETVKESGTEKEERVTYRREEKEQLFQMEVLSPKKLQACSLMGEIVKELKANFLSAAAETRNAHRTATQTPKERGINYLYKHEIMTLLEVSP